MPLPSGVAVKAAGKASADPESGCALAAKALPDAVRRAKAAMKLVANDKRFFMTPSDLRPPTLARGPERLSPGLAGGHQQRVRARAGGLR